MRNGFGNSCKGEAGERGGAGHLTYLGTIGVDEGVQGHAPQVHFADLKL